MGARQSREEAAEGERVPGRGRWGCFALRHRKAPPEDAEDAHKWPGLQERGLPLGESPLADCDSEQRSPSSFSARSGTLVPLGGGRRSGVRGSWKGKGPKGGGVPAGGGDLINQLPEECLVAIFEKAGGGSSKVIAAVCRKWKELLVGSRSVFLLPQCDPERLGALLSLLPGLTSLKVARTLEGGCFRTSDEALSAIGRHCTGLEAVDLGYNFLEGDKGTGEGPLQGCCVGRCT
jgi:hypothetical protein